MVIRHCNVVQWVELEALLGTVLAAERTVVRGHVLDGGAQHGLSGVRIRLTPDHVEVG